MIPGPIGINDLSLAEDAEDLAAFEDRAAEADLAFEDVLDSLKRSGKI